MAGVTGMHTMQGRRMAPDPRLSSELRTARESLGLSGDRVATAMGWSPSKISRIERCQFGISLADLERLLAYYRKQGMDAQKATALMRLGEHSADRVRRNPLNPHLAGVELACAVLQWSPIHVPKLLQVQQYITDALASRQPIFQYPPGLRRELAHAVADWQEDLTGRPPLRLRAVLDESVLYRKVGDADVMRAQLRYLDRIGHQKGTDIQVRILALDGGGPAEVSPFAYLEYPEETGVTAPPAICVDDLDGLRIPGMSEQAVWQRYLVFQQLWAAAEDPGPVIKRALHDAWPESG